MPSIYIQRLRHNEDISFDLEFIADVGRVVSAFALPGCLHVSTHARVVLLRSALLVPSEGVACQVCECRVKTFSCSLSLFRVRLHHESVRSFGSYWSWKQDDVKRG